MKHNIEIEGMKSAEHADGCVFPTGPDNQTCGRPVAISGKPGRRRPSYCDNPDHTRGKAFAVRRRYELAAARSHTTNQQAATQVEDGVPEHPVTDGRVSFGALLTRFEQSGTQLATILDRAIEVVRTVSDPDAASYEVEQIQRQAAIQIAEAQRLQAAAEHEASNARHQAAREAEQRAQADEAAEQALRQLHQIRDELAEARNATASAETERESAQREAEHHRVTIQSLRQRLEQQHHDYRHDLDVLRQQAQDERAALARHYTDQVTAIFAAIQQTGDHTKSQPAPAKPKIPPRQKRQDQTSTTRIGR